MTERTNGLNINYSESVTINDELQNLSNVNAGGLSTANSIDAPVTIEDGKEIVLFTSIYAYANSSTNFYDDMQIYAEKPEVISEYNYMQIVKCRFSN